MKTKQRLIYLIAHIDNLISLQLDHILQQSDFAHLFSTWQELSLLVSSINANKAIILQLLNISWQEIDKDINTSFDIEHTNLFWHVYESHLGVAGGSPISLLFGQYSINITNKNTINILRRLSELAAYALCPFISNLSSTLLNEFSINPVVSLEDSLRNTTLNEWANFRKNSNSRFIFLCGPNFNLVNNSSENALLHTNTISAGSLVTLKLIRSYIETNWFLEINGEIDLEMLCNLNKNSVPPVVKFTLQSDYYLNRQQLEKITELGFSFLLQENSRRIPYISSLHSTHIVNTEYHLLLEHLLTACHFGHHIKAIAQDKIGSLTSEAACEVAITHWLQRYTTNVNNATLRINYPLKSFNIKISAIPGKPGYFNCHILLEPHMKLESLTAKILLNSEILVSDLI